MQGDATVGSDSAACAHPAAALVKPLFHRGVCVCVAETSAALPGAMTVGGMRSRGMVRGVARFRPCFGSGVSAPGEALLVADHGEHPLTKTCVAEAEGTAASAGALGNVLRSVSPRCASAQSPSSSTTWLPTSSDSAGAPAQALWRLRGSTACRQ